MSFLSTRSSKNLEAEARIELSNTGFSNLLLTPKSLIFHYFCPFVATFGFERNHYDRIAHFSIGFYAFPLAEILKRNNLVNTHWPLYLFPLFAIISVAGVYELFEWQYAISADAEAGIAVLGSQGDIWDAQKDILSDTLGALFALFIFKLRK